jgi:hypothetical protein
VTGACFVLFTKRSNYQGGWDGLGMQHERVRWMHTKVLVENESVGKQPFLSYRRRRFCQIACGWNFLGCRNSIFVHSKVVSFMFNPRPGGPDPCSWMPQWQSGPARHRVPFSSPSTTRRATVELF